MRSIWKGSISFGLVNIPVRLYSAVESKALDFHMLYKKDLSRIQFKRVSESTGKEVPFEQIVKGYKLDDGNMVVVTDEELKEVAPAKSTLIEIQEFVLESEISTLFFDKPYYLEPDKGALKPYALLREALQKAGKVGISQFVLRNREHLCALKPQDNVLLLNVLRFASEIRDPGELALPQREKINSNEVSLAIKLIDALTEKFEPEKHRDTYTEQVKELLEAKAKGQKLKPAAQPAQAEKVVDLMAALQQSLKSSASKKKRAA